MKKVRRKLLRNGVFERLRNYYVNCSRSLIALPDVELDLVANRGAGKPFDIASVDEYVVGLSVDVDEAVSSVLEPSGYFTFHTRFTSLNPF